MKIDVIAAGLSTTVQDGGRRGGRHLGVGQAGALDPYSHSVANLLVGNPAAAPALEITLRGPTLRFDAPTVIAICGATIDAGCDGAPLPGWHRIALPAGVTVKLGPCHGGARAYLAVAGGIQVPMLMGSASTDLRGGFGGMRGRALVDGDTLDVAEAAHATHVDRVSIARWWVDPQPDLRFGGVSMIRVLPGHDDTQPLHALLVAHWRVASASDRQGVRLQGQPIAPADGRERISEPVLPGTIQLPPDGQPIVLLADAQTHGGYPRIGHAIAADWPVLAQLRPGAHVRFVSVSLEAAELALQSQRQRMARIALAISSRVSA